MAGYYDPNKDYSKELQRTDLTSAERSQLEQERQNKINDKYGGVEPNMYNSNKTYSQTVKKSGGSSSGKSSGGSPELVKGPGYVTGGYQTGAYGTAILDDNPYWKGASQADMSRRPDLAGKTAISNGYTVYYDENGYATKAVKGVTDYLPHQDFYVKTGQYSGGNLWTDKELLTASDLAQIAAIRNQMNAGQISGDQANALANKIRAGYGYTIDKAGNVTDLGVQSSVDARRQQWGMSTNPISEEQQKYLQLMFPEQGTSDSGALLSAMYALNQGNYNPETAYSAAQNAAAGIGGIVGATGGLTMGDYDDMTQYINDMYAQSLEAELAALKSAYDSNVAELESQNDRIAEQYRAARNQAAGQNELQRMQMNELGSAQGLNTGATGQMALAQSMAYQGNLGNLWAQEAQTQADVDLALAQLIQQYNANVNQTTAQINAQRNQALYDEMVRQQEWAAQQAEQSYEYAMYLLSNGIMPDSATLSNGGISATEAAAMVQLVNAQTGAATAHTDTATTPTATTAPKKTGGSYNNGSLNSAQVKQLQAYYGATPDGMWGANSKAAAGGLTADQAWSVYSQAGGTGINTDSFNQYGQSIMQQLAANKADAALGTVNQIWNQLSAEQQNTLQKNLSTYGITYQP